MRLVVILLASLTLACCDRPVTRSEARDIAEDMADAHTSRLEARVVELEQKIDGLERGESVDGARDNYIKAIHAAVSSEAQAREKQDEIIRKYYNDHLSHYHGVR